MIELTALTKPGPFSARTHKLGTFLGIRVDDELVAMAGERMKPAHYIEIARRLRCIHPTAAVATGRCCYQPSPRQIVSRGEIPFLHVFTSNHSAIALYRRQGMEIRRGRLHVTVLEEGGLGDIPAMRALTDIILTRCGCVRPRSARDIARRRLVSLSI